MIHYLNKKQADQLKWMLTESDNVKIPLFCYPIISHQIFFGMPLIWKSTDIPAEVTTKLFHFICTARGSNLKQFSEIILYWNLDGLLLALMLNSISFITFLRPLPFRFLKRKILIFAKTKDKHFQKQRPSLGIYISFGVIYSFDERQRGSLNF